MIIHTVKINIWETKNSAPTDAEVAAIDKALIQINWNEIIETIKEQIPRAYHHHITITADEA
ncbi:MAG TPA: hypothetical protein VGM54_13425 [Chthoniobacter sp.]|jgi:hypothetical protein